MANARELSSLARFIHALRAEKIRFQIVGMSAAILQGVPATTLDTDIWIDLTPRQYMRVLRIGVALGGQVVADTVLELPDGSLVNLLYHVDGLKSFGSEYRHATKLNWLGLEVRVLPLQRIFDSKSAIRRPKDLAHLPLLEQVIKLQKATKPGHLKAKRALNR